MPQIDTYKIGTVERFLNEKNPLLFEIVNEPKGTIV